MAAQASRRQSASTANGLKTVRPPKRMPRRVLVEKKRGVGTQVTGMPAPASNAVSMPSPAARTTGLTRARSRWTASVRRLVSAPPTPVCGTRNATRTGSSGTALTTCPVGRVGPPRAWEGGAPVLCRLLCSCHRRA